MAFVTADRVLDTSTSTGTGDLVVSGSSPNGYRTFSTVMSVADTCYYSAQHQTLNEWETGTATYSSANTLTRTTVSSSSNANAAVNFSAGTKDVSITFLASKSVQTNPSGQTVNSGGSYTRTAFTATAGQTSFTVSYTVNYVEVYVNGILLNSADYTASTGTTVVLAAAASSGDIIEVIALNVGTFTSGGYTRTTYTGTAGQTSFTASYTPGYVEVFLNGVLLDPTDYTATSGTAIVLGTGTAAGDTVDIVALNIGGFTGGVTVTGTPTSGQLTSWTGSSSIQGVASSSVDGNLNLTIGGNLSMSSSFLRNRLINGNMYVAQRLPAAVATTAASGTGSVATVTFSGGVTVAVGATVIITGMTPTGYNGTYTVTASSAGSVSFASTTTGAQTVAGQITYTSVTVTAGTTVPTISTGYPIVDRWFAYSTGANVVAAQVAGTGSNRSILQITGAASVTAVGVGQRIESLNSYDLSGKTCTLSVSLANSLLTTVTWTASYANTNDTFGTIGTATKTQIATGTFTVSSTLTRYTTNISVPAAATTGIEILFTVGAQTSGTWQIDDVQFEEGSIATPFERQPYTQQLQNCQRYYEKSYDQSVGPGTTVVSSGPWPGATQGVTVNTGYFNIVAPFSVVKFSRPTGVVYSPVTGNTSVVRNWTSGADFASGTVVAGNSSLSVANGATGLNAFIAYHWTASAEIP